MARRIMGDSESIAASRSPLTDHELTTLLKDTSVAQVVFGTPALGIGRVVEVIKRQADNENVAPIVVDSLQSPELKRAGAGGKRAHVIVDLTASKADGNLAHICREAAARKNVTATVVIGPEWLDNMLTLDGVEVHTLRRWSVTGLRAWYGSPFDSPLERARLHRVTSGWPKLIEEVMAAFSKGLAPQTALDRAAARLANRERATESSPTAASIPRSPKPGSNPFHSPPDLTVSNSCRCRSRTSPKPSAWTARTCSPGCKPSMWPTKTERTGRWIGSSSPRPPPSTRGLNRCGRTHLVPARPPHPDHRHPR